MAATIPGVSPETLARKLERMITCPLEYYTPLLITGIPGVGKTSIVGQKCRQLNVPFWVIRPILHESIEFTGLPCNVESNGHAVWKPFEELLPVDPNWEGVIFLDEVSQCGNDLQKPIAALLDKEGVAGRRIPKGARFVLAGNRVQDKAGASRLLSIIESRCQQIELLFSLKDWLQWGESAGIDQTVMSFAEFKGGDFVRFQPESSLNPLPRCWHRVSNEIKTVGDQSTSKDDPDVLSSVAGLVGPGPASEYLAFREHFHLFHKVVDKVFKDPESVDLRNELSAQHALIGALTQRVKEDQANLSNGDLENVVVFGSTKLAKPLQFILFRNMMVVANRRFVKIKRFYSWAQEPSNAEILKTWKS